MMVEQNERGKKEEISVQALELKALSLKIALHGHKVWMGAEPVAGLG